jgi:tetratricopeptide (TPR) repeat protein
MFQTRSATAVAADPIINAVVSPEASLVARDLLRMVLAYSALFRPDWVAVLKALLANVLMNDVLNWWNGAGADELNEASVAADEAIKLNSNSALAHHAKGLVHSGRRHHDDARKAFRDAKQLDRGFARGHAQFGNQKSFLGRLDEVQDPLDKAISLSPDDPASGYFYWGKGRGYFEAAVRSNAQADWSNAIEWLTKSVEALPTVWYNRCYLAAAQNNAGDANGRRQTITNFKNDPRFDQATFDRIKQLNPDPKEPARKSMLDFVQPLL